MLCPILFRAINCWLNWLIWLFNLSTFLHQNVVKLKIISNFNLLVTNVMVKT
uniref:Uncharacterized protein n=1 Tax=Solanum lycopersicum TaxID=4081 RepID=A0A3Q7HWA5_SOLLC